MSPEDINWTDQESFFLHNPKLPIKDKEILAQLQSELPEIESCLWVLTSGSTGLNQYKWIALKKQAFLESAKAVNKRIDSNAKDIWLNVLPSFHVGGLSVWARAHLSGAQVKEFLESWNPHKFIHSLESNKVTLTSLVPTQLYDLVHSELPCPKSLRAIFVGGGPVSNELYLKSRDLGYPVLPTYGMTEVCSQIATAELSSLNEHQFPDAVVLDHIEVRKNSDGVLEVRGPSLLSGVAYIENGQLSFREHKPEEWYSTGDIGDIQQGCIKVRGRKSELVKVLGELVSFPRLRSILELLHHEQNATLIPIPDERAGHAVAMVFETKDLNTDSMNVVSEFNDQVAAFERVTQVYFVDEIPRTAIGKLQQGKLKQQLGVE